MRKKTRKIYECGRSTGHRFKFRDARPHAIRKIDIGPPGSLSMTRLVSWSMQWRFMCVGCGYMVTSLTETLSDDERKLVDDAMGRRSGPVHPPTIDDTIGASE